MSIDSHMARPPKGYYWSVTQTPRENHPEEGYAMTLYKRKWLVWRKRVATVRAKTAAGLMEDASAIVRGLKT